MRDLSADLRYAVRAIVRSPGYALTATIVLGLAIAANAVAFSFVNSLFLRPPAVQDPARLVRIYTTYSEGPRYFTLSYPDFRDIERLTDTFSGVVADYPAPFSVTADGVTERRWGYLVSGNYFSALGVRAGLGRVFAGDDEAVRATDLPVVLSDSGWRRRFGADRHVIGRTIEINGRHATVLGVAPAAFTGLNVGIRPDFWIPVRAWTQPAGGVDPLDERGSRGYFVVARLQPGVGLERSRAAIAVLARRLQTDFPDSNRAITFTVLPESRGGVHPLVRGPFVSFTAALSAVVGLVLVLACASIAGLLVARAAGRSREIGVRLALGATRWRIVRQLLTESSLLWCIAGAAGMAGGAAVVRWLAAIQLPTDRPVFVDISVDARVLGFAGLATVATAVIFGITPALAAARSSPADALRASIAGRARSSLRLTLVAGQVALCIALLVAAGLCLRSLSASERIDLGFEPHGIALASIDPALRGYDWGTGIRFVRTLRDRVAADPGVAAAGLANRVPFEMNVIRTKVEPVGGSPSGALPSVDFAIVDGGYFAAMRIPVIAGRVFSSLDTPDTFKVAVVNETLARRLWPGETAVGKRIRVGNAARQVAGVVKDGKYLTLGEEPTAFVYLPFEQDGGSAMTIVARAADPAGALRRIREDARTLDAALPLYNARTMEEHLQIAAAPVRATSALVAAFAALALLLACVGLYGLLAYWVAQRTREIGIRRALGAADRDVVLLVTSQALGPVLAGAIAGAGLAALLSRVLRGILYGVAGSDPAAYTGAAAALLVTAAVACSIPAYRAMRVEPIDALRHE